MLSLEAKVGAFVLAGLVLIASAIFLLGDYTFERRYTIYTTFTDVANLSKDAPVKLSGVEVGKVKGLVLEDHHAKVIAAIQAIAGTSEQELSPKRLYSRYVARCVEAGTRVAISAPGFYEFLANLPVAETGAPGEVRRGVA